MAVQENSMDATPLQISQQGCYEVMPTTLRTAGELATLTMPTGKIVNNINKGLNSHNF